MSLGRQVPWMEVIGIIESSCKSCKDQFETEHLKCKLTKGIATWVAQRVHDAWQFYNGILFETEHLQGKAIDLSIICNSVTLGSKINHIEYCSLRGCWWRLWGLFMTLPTAWSRRLGSGIPGAIGGAWPRHVRGIRAWLVRTLISFASTRAWCGADRWLRTWAVAAVLPAGATLLSFAFLQLRGAWWAPWRPPMLASSRLADFNGGAKSKQDKEKQEAEVFCSQLHPSVRIYWLCGD